jgi:metal transporter CNNM
VETLVFVLVIAGLVIFSALCSGLNVGLVSLSVSDLKLKSKMGDSRAKKILPLRQNYHLSLASILLSNVAAISATSLVLDQQLNGFLAGLLSTLLIVVFGEVLPQAYFAQYALTFSARLAPLLQFMIIATYPISKMLQLLLDKLFGKHGDNIRLNSRRELGLIISEHLGRNASELDDDEVEIIRSTLTLSEKRVREIYTPIRNVYWITPQTNIDTAKIDEIKNRAWSRIPVLNKELTECYGILLMKDLVDIDFDSHPVSVQDLPLHKTKTVGSMTALDTLFRKFIGAHSHLMPVEKNGKIIGIVTIEDLIEEIIGHEIEDERDHGAHTTIINQSD